jgi:chromosomal replication initiator protein
MYPARGRRQPSIGQIQAQVASHYRLPVSDLVGAGRTARVAWARQVAIYLVRELTGSPLQAIGEAFGGRNHATVLHACKRVSERMKSDQQAVDEIAALADRLGHDEGDREP